MGKLNFVGESFIPSREGSVTATVLDGYSPRSALPWKLSSMFETEKVEGHGWRLIWFTAINVNVWVFSVSDLKAQDFVWLQRVKDRVM